MNRFYLVLFLILIAGLFITGCSSDDDDSDNNDNNHQDDDDDDDTVNQDDDDDNTDDDDDDDDDDDTTLPDEFIASWPQNNIEVPDYDETVNAGPLRQKAEDYDQWHFDNHQPYAGGTVGAAFTDDARTNLSHYFDWNDSCEWTGLYLGSQAMRYHITGDTSVRNNVIRIVEYLSGNLHITETPGFIARYWAEQDPHIYPNDAWCDSEERCHKIDSGPYAGNWWWGETSRDMYGGWFFGMSLAYDHVDDQEMRDLIKADVLHVLTTLMNQNWTILNEIGEPTDSAPDVMAPFRFSWLTIGYHVTGDATIKAELEKLLKNDQRILLRLSSISFMNRYTQYFGSCLAHEYWYNFLRLGKVYFSQDDYDFLINLFETQTHTYTRLSHNPFFNGVYMGQGSYEPSDFAADPYQEQLEEDLTDFRDAPNYRYYLPPKDPSDYVLDPVSVFLHDLMVDYPFLGQIMGNVYPQALDAFPVDEQCTTDFLFQRNPFKFDECGNDDIRTVNPGVDYLISYWLASYHKFISKEM